MPESFGKIPPAPFSRAVRGRFFKEKINDKWHKRLLSLQFPLKKGGSRGLFPLMQKNSVYAALAS
jgi:hypothetical protein